jgi:tripartite tricarboxylate transporter family receptor
LQDIKLAMVSQRIAVLRKVRSGSRLGNHGAKRDAAAPDVPTIAEAGVPGYDVTAWQTLFVPAKTPPEIVHKIDADTNTALADPAIKDKLAKTGYVWVKARRHGCRLACLRALRNSRSDFSPNYLALVNSHCAVKRSDDQEAARGNHWLFPVSLLLAHNNSFD